MSSLISGAERLESALRGNRPGTSTSRRQLACVLCQRRKAKCDHNYPCATCVKARVQCVPATQVTRRRRFPERELLSRLRHYEELLTQHDIHFDPLHRTTNPKLGKKDSAPMTREAPDSEDEQSGTTSASVGATKRSPSSTSGISEWREVHKNKRVFHTLREEVRNPDNDDSSDDEVGPAVFKKTWDQTIEKDDYLLFGWPHAPVAMYTLHPEPVQIFQLWQLYLDNVNPLLKVTHSPNLQGRIIEAAGNVLNIKPELEALMFSIYCTAIMSITDDECLMTFGLPRAELMATYQFGCQQALLNSRFLRCTSRDCLIALYLYLVSVRPNTAPESLSSILGIAVRTAQRIGIHNEATLAKMTVLEAEMSRRLWWSLILFDTRIGEMADFQATSLLPSWDCRAPLNVNEADLRPEMKDSPQVQGTSSDALFTVVRSELADLIRRTKFHLGFFGPAVRPREVADIQRDADAIGSEMDCIERIIEGKYLRFCDDDIPLHYMTLWTSRGSIAKYRLMEHHFKYSGTSLHQAGEQREAALSYALAMLTSNTKLMTSPLSRPYVWMVYAYFPFVAYIQIVQYLKWRPTSLRAAEVWQVMSENYDARGQSLSIRDGFFKLLAKLVLEAWDSRLGSHEQAAREDMMATPQIVLSITDSLKELESQRGLDGLNDGVYNGSPYFGTSSPMDLGTMGSWSNLGQDGTHSHIPPTTFPDVPGLSLEDLSVDQGGSSGMTWDIEETTRGMGCR